MLSQLSLKWVRLSSFLADSVSTVGFILIVVFGALVHLLGLVGLPWSLWSFGELIFTGAPGSAFGWLLALTAVCLIVFWIIYFLATITNGNLKSGQPIGDLILLVKVAISIAFSAAGAVLTLNGSAEIPGLLLFVPWLNLGLWVWAVIGL